MGRHAGLIHDMPFRSWLKSPSAASHGVQEPRIGQKRAATSVKARHANSMIESSGIRVEEKQRRKSSLT